MKKKLVIIASVAEEFESVYHHRKDLAKRWNCTLEFKTLGIGPINAAANSAIYAGRFSNAEFLLLGSCGRYDTSISLLEPVTPVRHYFGSIEIARGRGYVPAFTYEPFELPGFPGLKPCDCLTTPSITADSKNGEILIKHYQTQVEHLESYGGLKPLFIHKIPTRAILIPVNDVGPDAHHQYRTNAGSGLSILNETILGLEVFPWIEQ